MIEIQGLTKTFGSVVAVRDVTFTSGEGAVVGLLGPNGAGKTTTLRMLAGVTGPTSGRIVIAHNDIIESPVRARACIGYLAETSPLYPEMYVGDYLRYRAALKGVKRKSRSAAVQEAVDATHCADVIDVGVSQLSRGYRQRVGLADALLAHPPVLLLDEPTAGLDPNQIREVRDLIGQLAQKHTILLSTHVLAEVEAVCTEAVVIHRGQLVAHGTLDSLRVRRQVSDVVLLVRDPKRLTPTICSNLGWHVASDSNGKAAARNRVESELCQYVVGPAKVDEAAGMRLEELIAELVRAGVGLREVQRVKPTLEAVFAELTDDGEASQP